MAGVDELQLFTAGECIQHPNYRVTAQSKDVLHIPALQIVNDQISNQLFTHG